MKPRNNRIFWCVFRHHVTLLCFILEHDQDSDEGRRPLLMKIRVAALSACSLFCLIVGLNQLFPPGLTGRHFG